MASLSIELAMTIILLSMCGVIAVLVMLQTKKPGKHSSSSFLPNATTNLNKYEFEKWALTYTGIWIGVFTVVIIFQMYESFDENSYMILCGGLASPFLLQPFLFPLPSERNLPLFQRYSFKANVWIVIYSFIGNYWYTHYFYNVLKASYTFPSHRLNDVPIAMYFSTHFYFVTYHTFSNVILRKIETTFVPNMMRLVLFVGAVLVFSYFTAFMETLTISSFPYYSFEDRYHAYTVGSAFYALYFIVSFPMFYFLDENNNLVKDKPQPRYNFYQTVIESFAAGMMILCLLDFGRLVAGIPLKISGVGYYVYKPTK
ncbi:hypothetical protein EON65_30605 [archaeon]|nr:MAG: hypothetical protein EON65_30605 [archaeon]